MSASCSIDPDSRMSDNTGRLSCRCSTPRDNCDRAITGHCSSLANFFSCREISETSC